MRKIPDTFIIIFFLIIAAAILTWLVPGGEYTHLPDTANGTTKSPVFQQSESVPQSWQVFTAFQKGFVLQAHIIIFVLIVGGSFWMINQTRAIDVGIYRLLEGLKKLERGTRLSFQFMSNLILIIIMLAFSIFGAVFGMSEETIAFVGIIVPLAISLGYDSITGVSLVFVAAGLGFAGAILNPFTIGIAQQIAGIPMFSGIEYRLVCWLAINLIGFTYILRYANKVRKNPALSPVYAEDSEWRSHKVNTAQFAYKKNIAGWVVFSVLSVSAILFSIYFPLTRIKTGNIEFTGIFIPTATFLFMVSGIFMLRKSLHFFILNLIVFTIIFLLIGVLGYEWYINEIAAIFMVLGLSSSIAYGFKGNEIVRQFKDGAQDILGAALIIGLAGGIIVILKDGKIIEPLLHYASKAIENSGKTGTIGIMYLIQTALNIIIPSGSAKAAITMPIMAPFSDLVMLSRQATVMAFQFGDGFTNLITPTSGVLMAVLGVAKIPYAKWFRWILPLVLILIVAGFLLLIPTVLFELNGF
ncbi:MAG: YfcC family protein [Bacteroidales bacterium]|nr:YfcC family protein [Bacteroidales bacterium]